MLTFHYIYLPIAKCIVLVILIRIEVTKVTFIIINKIKITFLTAIKITMDFTLLGIISVFKDLINKWWISIMITLYGGSRNDISQCINVDVNVLIAFISNCFWFIWNLSNTACSIGLKNWVVPLFKISQTRAF